MKGERGKGGKGETVGRSENERDEGYDENSVVQSQKKQEEASGCINVLEVVHLQAPAWCAET